MNKKLGSILAAVAVNCLLVLVIQAQTTTFTYQGRLTNSGTPPTANYDMQFRLFDDPNAGQGTQQGVTFTNSTVPVNNGIFTVQLDFGAAPFATGANLYLEISVRTAGSTGGYTSLAPRQPITSTPYAIRALSAANVESTTTAGNSVVNAINNATTIINDSALPTNIVRLKPAAPQFSASNDANGSDALINLRGTFTTPTNGSADFKVQHNGGILATGFVRDVGNATGCASSIPATGAGTRFMWFPCRGSLRFGRVPTGQTNWDDANMDDFTFAGGNQVTASGYGAFAFGDQVTVSSTVGVGFGSGVTVSGTAGFSAGAGNVCSGFACVAIGYTNQANGQGSVALGYRATAASDYSTSIGYRATNCSSTTSGSTNGCAGTPRYGAVVISATNGNATYVNAQADAEFRLRAPGGVRLRTSDAANAAAGVSGNTGCDLAAGSGAFVCSSSRTIKSNFSNVRGEDVLQRIAKLPMTTWNYTLEGAQSRHIGPVAEDFYSAFKFGESDKSIAIQDLAGVSLVGVKALAKRTTELQAENDDLKQRLAALEGRFEQLLNQKKQTNRRRR